MGQAITDFTIVMVTLFFVNSSLVHWSSIKARKKDSMFLKAENILLDISHINADIFDMDGALVETENLWQ